MASILSLQLTAVLSDLTALLGDWRASLSIELSLKRMCLCPNSCIIPCAKSTQSLAKQHSSGQVTGHKGAALTWRINNKAFEWASNALFSLLICAPFGISTDQLLPVWWERKVWGGKIECRKRDTDLLSQAKHKHLCSHTFPLSSLSLSPFFLFHSQVD